MDRLSRTRKRIRMILIHILFTLLRMPMKKRIIRIHDPGGYPFRDGPVGGRWCPHQSVRDSLY